MSFLLMIFLTLVCLFPAWPAPPWRDSPAASALLTALAVLLVAAHAFWVSRRVSWPLSRDPLLRDKLLKRYERGRFVHQFLHLGLFVLALTLLGWGWSLRQVWQRGEGSLPGAEVFSLGGWTVFQSQPSERNLPGLEILTLLPFLISQALTWLFFYDADRAAHRAVGVGLETHPEALSPTWLETQQARAVPFDGRWSYIAFQARQKFALVFIPVALLIAQKELTRLIPAAKDWPTLFSIVGIAALGCVFLCMPLIIRVLLGLKPLPPGPVRNRLLAASKRLNFRTSDILLWNTKRGMANALVIGLVPWLRYVVFTDRLLEEFTEEEIEAVYGHEVGHVRHQHMLYYLCFLSASMVALGLLTDRYLSPLVEQFLTLPAGDEPGRVDADLMVFPAIGLMLAYLFVVFGFLSRRCERQADVFGCRAVSCGDPCCRGHDEKTQLVPGGKGLCVTGIQTFIRALDKVALVNGISRERPGFFQSWQHSTIAKRVAFLDGVIIDRQKESAFQSRLWRVKWALMVVLTVALVAMTAANGWTW